MVKLSFDTANDNKDAEQKAKTSSKKKYKYAEAGELSLDKWIKENCINYFMPPNVYEELTAKLKLNLYWINIRGKILLDEFQSTYQVHKIRIAKLFLTLHLEKEVEFCPEILKQLQRFIMYVEENYIINKKTDDEIFVLLQRECINNNQILKDVYKQHLDSSGVSFQDAYHMLAILKDPEKYVREEENSKIIKEQEKAEQLKEEIRKEKTEERKKKLELQIALAKEERLKWRADRKRARELKREEEADRIKTEMKKRESQKKESEEKQEDSESKMEESDVQMEEKIIVEEQIEQPLNIKDTKKTPGRFMTEENRQRYLAIFEDQKIYKTEELMEKYQCKRQKIYDACKAARKILEKTNVDDLF